MNFGLKLKNPTELQGGADPLAPRVPDLRSPEADLRSPEADLRSPEADLRSASAPENKNIDHR